MSLLVVVISNTTNNNIVSCDDSQRLQSSVRYRVTVHHTLWSLGLKNAHDFSEHIILHSLAFLTGPCEHGTIAIPVVVD